MAAGTGSGAALAWWVRTGRGAPRLPPERILADGSWLSRLDPEGRTGQPVVVRVLEHAIDDPGRPTATGQVYRLVTSILDPQAAPASELAVLYHQRREIEGVLDELKTHQRGPRAVLRSKTPAMVEQEVWAHLLVHYAIRKLMHQAAIAEILTERLPPRRLRAFPRAVKRKMSDFKLKRPAHRSWPQPTRPDTQAIVLLPRPGQEIPQIGARR